MVNDLPNKNSEFNMRLKIAMEKAKLNQSRLAKEMGLSPTAINKYLQGINIPKKKLLERLAKVLNVNILWLQGYSVTDKDIKSEIIMEIEKNSNFLETEDDTNEREEAQEHLELLDKIKALKGYELFNLNRRFEQLISIDDNDWELLLLFNTLNKTGKNKILGFIKDITLINKYLSGVSGEQDI